MIRRVFQLSLLFYFFFIIIALTGCEPIDSIIPPDIATSFNSYQFEASNNTELSSDVTGIIDIAKHTISLTVPDDTDVTSLVATFTLPDNATAKIGRTSQESGVTANDFTKPVVYIVTAKGEEYLTQDWVVTVHITQPTYIISASTSPGGYISPSGDVAVEHGSDQDFAIIPSPGYQIEEIQVDDLPVEITELYTFYEVTQHHIIVVTFSETQSSNRVHNISKGTYYDTIQEAIDDAENNNVIEVDDGTYHERLWFPNYPAKSLTLRSINGSESTIISCDSSYSTVLIETYSSSIVTELTGFKITHQGGSNGRGLDICGGTVEVNHCNISGNSFDYDGGGIINIGTLTINNSTISYNQADHGGGIATGGTMTMNDCTVSSNDGGGITTGGTMTMNNCTVSSNDGRGITCSNNSTVTINNSTITNNSAGMFGGGGIYCAHTNLNINTSTISDNSGVFGGGLFLRDTSAMINSSTISENEAEQDGGGIMNDNFYYDDGMLTIINSTITDNQTLHSGGGIYNACAYFNINDCTISNNRAEINGGAILNEGIMTMYDCTIENNYADNSGGAMAILDETGLVIKGNTISSNSATHGGGIMLWLTSQVPDIGGLYQNEKNTICGNYKETDAASVHQAIRDYYTGSLYYEYRYTNDITANCPQ